MPAKVLENFPGNKALTWEAFWHLKHTKSNYLASRRLSGRVPDCFNRIPLILRSICPYMRRALMFEVSDGVLLVL